MVCLCVWLRVCDQCSYVCVCMCLSLYVCTLTSQALDIATDRPLLKLYSLSCVCVCLPVKERVRCTDEGQLAQNS